MEREIVGMEIAIYIVSIPWMERVTSSLGTEESRSKTNNFGWRPDNLTEVVTRVKQTDILKRVVSRGESGKQSFGWSQPCIIGVQ